MMKTVFMVLWVVVAFARASGHELPMFGAVPKLSEEWRVRERETARFVSCFNELKDRRLLVVLRGEAERQAVCKSESGPVVGHGERTVSWWIHDVAPAQGVQACRLLAA
jgi:hypothetical protein